MAGYIWLNNNKPQVRRLPTHDGGTARRYVMRVRDGKQHISTLH